MPEFSLEYAAEFGLEEAVMLEVLRSLPATDDGWITGDMKAVCKAAPYWTIKQARRIVESLVKQGALLKRSAPETSWDRTCRYVLTERFLKPSNQPISPNGQMHLPKREDACSQTGKCGAKEGAQVPAGVPRSDPSDPVLSLTSPTETQRASRLPRKAVDFNTKQALDICCSRVRQRYLAKCKEARPSCKPPLIPGSAINEVKKAATTLHDQDGMDYLQAERELCSFAERLAVSGQDLSFIFRRLNDGRLRGDNGARSPSEDRTEEYERRAEQRLRELRGDC